MAFLEVERRDGWARLVLKRVDALNALNRGVLEELAAAWEAVEAWDDVTVLLVTSASPKAFAAGADIGEIHGLATAHEARAFAAAGQAVFNRVAASRLVSVAAVGGFALGGGLELALACDLRLLGADAQLGLPETGLGLIPGFGGTQRLVRLTGESRALWMILSGARIDAGTAERWGLAHAVVPSDELQAAAEGLAATLAARPALALELAKKAVRVGGGMPLGHGMELEATLFGLAAATPDAREGTGAFLERRAPVFRRPGADAART